MSDLGIVQKRVDAEISIDGREGFVLGGDVDIEIVIDEKDNALVVPRKAVFSLNREDCVYTVQDGKAALRRVEVGLKGEELYEIVSNLEEGEIVIVSPDSDVSDGSRVRVE
jgi:HlyD family secretion protein